MRRFPLAILALGLALIGASSAQAQSEPRASDGQSLSSQPQATQDLFQGVWGAGAASAWLAEHNAATAGAAVVPIVTAAPPTPVSIAMNDHDQFVPASLRVPLNTAVTWRNDDTDPHTVTGDPLKSFPGVRVVEPGGALPWDSGLVGPKQNFTFTFTTAGHYIYICTVHAGSGMVGTVDVG